MVDEDSRFDIFDSLSGLCVDYGFLCLEAGS